MLAAVGGGSEFQRLCVIKAGNHGALLEVTERLEAWLKVNEICLDGEPKLFSFEGPASGWDGNVSSMSVAHCVAASLAQTEHRRQW